MFVKRSEGTTGPASGWWGWPSVPRISQPRCPPLGRVRAAVREPLALPQPRPARRCERVPREPDDPPEAAEGGLLLHAHEDAVGRKNPASGTTEAGHCVTPTGLEGAVFAGVSGVYAFPGIPAPSVTLPLDGTDASDPSGLPSPLPSFLEACVRLAVEAVSRGDFAGARDLMEKAERVASLRLEPPRPTRG